MIEDFFSLPPASTTPVVHLRNGPNGILRGLDSWKKPEVRNLVTLSLLAEVN